MQWDGRTRVVCGHLWCYTIVAAANRHQGLGVTNYLATGEFGGQLIAGKICRADSSSLA